MYLTPKQVASHLQVSRGQVAKLLAWGHLRGSKVGNLWRIDPADLEAYLASRSNQPTPTVPTRKRLVSAAAVDSFFGQARSSYMPDPRRS